MSEAKNTRALLHLVVAALATSLAVGCAAESASDEEQEDPDQTAEAASDGVGYKYLVASPFNQIVTAYASSPGCYWQASMQLNYKYTGGTTVALNSVTYWNSGAIAYFYGSYRDQYGIHSLPNTWVNPGQIKTLWLGKTQ